MMARDQTVRGPGSLSGAGGIAGGVPDLIRDLLRCCGEAPDRVRNGETLQ